MLDNQLISYNVDNQSNTNSKTSSNNLNVINSKMIEINIMNVDRTISQLSK